MRGLHPLSILWFCLTLSLGDACNCTSKKPSLKMVGLPPVQKLTSVTWQSVLPHKGAILEYNVLYNSTSKYNHCECQPDLDRPSMYIAKHCRHSVAKPDVVFTCDITKDVSQLGDITNHEGSLCVVVMATSRQNNFTYCSMSAFVEWSISDCTVCPAPENVQITTEQPRSFTVRWNTPQYLPSLVQQYSTYYRVYYQTSNKGAKPLYINFPLNASKANNHVLVVHDLGDYEVVNVWVECSLYNLWSSSCKAEKAGPYSVTTLQGAPSKAPSICDFFTDLNDGRVDLRIKYELPPKEKWNGFPVYSQAQYCAGSANMNCSIVNITSIISATPVNGFCGPTARQGRVTGLLRDTKYLFRIRICTSAGCSSWSSPWHTISSEEPPNKSARSLLLTEWVVGVCLAVVLILVVVIGCWTLRRGRNRRLEPLAERVADLNPYQVLNDDGESAGNDNEEYATIDVTSEV